MTATGTPPDHLVVVNSAGGQKLHVLDVRYAPLGKALCGARVLTSQRYPKIRVTSADCKSCRIASGASA